MQMSNGDTYTANETRITIMGDISMLATNATALFSDKPTADIMLSTQPIFLR